MENREAKELLKKYLSGQCTDREIEIIERWYKSFDASDDNTKNIDFDNAKRQMLQNINKGIHSNERASKTISPKEKANVYYLKNYFWRGVAALLITGLIFGAIFYSQPRAKKTETVVAEEIPLKIEPLPSTIFFSDGSTVWLKGDSRLEYPPIFLGNNREVTLVGEAFFEIAKDENRPFVIKAGNLTTKVLGTSFNIKAYDNEESAEVEVVTGKVKVTVNKEEDTSGSEVVLEKNQKAIYTKTSNTLVQAETNYVRDPATPPKSRLIFNETPLEEIVKVLNAYYGVNIRLDNESLKNCLLTAELTDEPLDVSLKIITKAVGAEFELDKKEIKITGKGCGYHSNN